MESGQQTVTIPQAIRIALERHRAGRLAEAERIYRQVLEVEPDNADALHLLGTIANQAGKHQLAVEFIGKALAVKPDLAEAHYNLGNALNELGKREEALASYRNALSFKPDLAEAHANLGNALREQGKRDEAVASYLKALSFKPNFAEAHNNLGNALEEQGKLHEAIVSYRKALSLKPDFAEAHYNLGNALREQGKLHEAIVSYRKALSLKPDFAEAHFNLGNALRVLGKPDEAVASYGKALSFKPDYAEAHTNLGNVLKEQSRLEEALAAYLKAVRFKPDYAEAHNNLGVVFQEQGRLDEALASYLKALSFKPDYAEAHSNLGNALREQGKLEDAERSCRQALAIKPTLANAHSNLIFVLDLQERCDIREQQEERRRWYAAHGRFLADSISQHGNSPDPERQIRIGYVSADFCRHSPYYAFGPVIAFHDRPAFEIICYSGVRREDDATSRLRRAANLWRSTLGISDEALAGQIRRDGIDILVDLSGHMRGNRLLVFARKPAPIQVTAWGYANGTGLETMDYLLSDPVALPKEERPNFAEKVIDLPCVLCCEAPEYLPAVSPLPSLAGMPFTFGCVNRIEKISDGALDLWGRILAMLPDARLLVKDVRLHNIGAREHLLGRLTSRGVGHERVLLLGGSSHAEHLKSYHEVDVVLDPFPHGGGISTAEALWMGVPVVTLCGLTIPGRVSASILAALGMHGQIAHSAEDYVQIALSMAGDLPLLARMREELRPRMAASVVGDVQGYTRAVEQAYRSMWRSWCEQRNCH